METLLLQQWQQEQQWKTLIKLNKKGGIRYSNYTNVIKAQIRGISSITILKWIMGILIF